MFIVRDYIMERGGNQSLAGNGLTEAWNVLLCRLFAELIAGQCPFSLCSCKEKVDKKRKHARGRDFDFPSPGPYP
jgi:hypothetical protein